MEYFYPRSPCGERLPLQRCDTARGIYFYPRSPCGERLPLQMCDTARGIYFYPRSPCGERRYVRRMARQAMYISIHALLAESDLTCPVHILPCNVFLSTLSLRRATIENFSALNNILISIHALLAESDVVHALKFANFVLFLSTLSLRRATGNIINSNCNFTHFYPRSPCGERQ